MLWLIITQGVINVVLFLCIGFHTHPTFYPRSWR